MFQPIYTISAKLLKNIKRITTLVHDLNHKKFSKVVLMDLVKNNPKHIRDSEREILNYNNALVWLESLPKKNVTFDGALIRNIHKIITIRMYRNILKKLELSGIIMTYILTLILLRGLNILRMGFLMSYCVFPKFLPTKV